MPAKTFLANQKDLNPNIVRVMRLTARWSWRAMLLRYLANHERDGVMMFIDRIDGCLVCSAFIYRGFFRHAVS